MEGRNLTTTKAKEEKEGKKKKSKKIGAHNSLVFCLCFLLQANV